MGREVGVGVGQLTEETAWSIPVLAERGTQCGFYPVAEIYGMGSGSNKFCLEVLVGYGARFGATQGWRVRRLRAVGD